MSVTAVIVDDSPLEANQLAGILKRVGVTVLQIEHKGDSGLAAILKHEPTICTLDINLPMMSGLEIARHLKASKCPTKIVACSGLNVGAVKRQLEAIGIALFIKKPYDDVLTLRDMKSIL